MSWLRRWLRRTVVLLVALALVPFALLLLYRVEAVHPVSTLMVSHWMSGNGVRREWVEIEDVSSNLKNAVIMSEDGRFCFHDGVDWGAVREVVDEALDGGRTRGASTIAMQTVKNLFLWNGRSFVRKGLEVPLALAADFILGKRRLMEIYLNIAEWGRDGDTVVFGAQAGAKHHFGRSAAKLNGSQGGLMAVTLPAPAVRRAGRPRKGLARLGRRAATRAARSGAYVKCLYD